MDHETIEASALSVRETYQLMTDLVAPRPIAWVSTQDSDGRRNLAPFSYYQAVCSHPPMIVIACSWRPDGRPKDTLRNILATGELVVNHTDRTLAEAMNATSGDYPPEIDEWQEVARVGVASLTPVASTHVSPPRIGQVSAALECRLVHAIPLGTGPHGRPSSTLVVAEVVAFQLAQGLLRRDARGRTLAIDPTRLGAVGRLGGIAYTDTTGLFHLARPKIGSDA
jgi:flavin reductase (DIM6/NTAB) family NADH-FMN oxidoreductase RutF